MKYVSLGEDDDFDEEDEKEGISSKAVYSAANSFLSGSVSGLKAMELERKEKYRDKINALREVFRKAFPVSILCCECAALSIRMIILR